MGNVTPELTNPEKLIRARQKAVSAFSTIGERLKSIYARDVDPEGRERLNHWFGAEHLYDTIEGEIIPRLMLAHREPDSFVADADSVPSPISADERTHFLELIRSGTAASAENFANSLLDRGIARETVFIDLLGGAARTLGEMWERDECDFTEVTIGLCRLHEILRHQSADAFGLSDDVHVQPGAPRILLSTACNDQHVFGVVMVAEFFRNAGWWVSSEPGASTDELQHLLQSQHFDVIGLSAARSTVIQEISTQISVLRGASKNADLKVLVGGRLFSEDPELAGTVGADAFAGDAKTAAAIGEKLLAAEQADC